LTNIFSIGSLISSAENGFIAINQGNFQKAMQAQVVSIVVTVMEPESGLIDTGSAIFDL
jgi:hypothetical protein